MYRMYRSANSGTVIQSKEEMAWARSVRSAGEKHVQNIETIMALFNMRILRCLPPCCLVQRYLHFDGVFFVN